ncbi:uncharacterized protein METZ01_LOCUS144867, partial [marine metagenome]
VDEKSVNGTLAVLQLQTCRINLAPDTSRQNPTTAVSPGFALPIPPGPRTAVSGRGGKNFILEASSRRPY